MEESRREELIAHREFVRALARRLVLDPDKGDDVSQEALLAALEASRPRGPVRRWLSGVVRNLAYRMLRGDDRRRRREALRALPDRTRATGDVVADLELHREVVDALLALEEPYRTTLLLHFFEDLPPRDIAKRQGLPGATVRSHLKRGIERLRRLLDERHKGRAWCLALVPLAFPARVGAPLPGVAGVAVMSAKSKLSIAAVALLLLAVVPVASYWTARSASREGVHRAESPHRAPPVEESEGGGGTAKPPTLAVEVRVLGPGDAPLPGANVLVFVDSEREWLQGFASMAEAWFQRDWTNATGGAAPILVRETDGAGLARLDLMPGKSLRLEARKPGYSRAEVTLYYMVKAPDRPYQLRLSRAHALAGKVVDSLGRPVAGATVAAGAANLPAQNMFVALPYAVAADGEGRYAFDSLTAGDVSLWAALPGCVPAYVATVRVPDVATFDIALEPGGTLTGKVTEKGTGRALAGIDVRVEVRSTPPAFGRGVTNREGVYEIRGLACGQVDGLFAFGSGYALEVPAGWDSWILPQIAASETTVEDLEVVRTGAIKGTVRGPDGVLPGVVVEAVCRMRHEYAIYQSRTDAQGAYRIGNLPPASYLVRAATPQLHEPGAFEYFFQAFEPGGESRLTTVPGGGEAERSFLLEGGSGVIEGRVEDANGAPLAGAKVGGGRASAVTGPSGDFRLEGCVPAERVDLGASLEGYRMDGVFPFVALKPHQTVTGAVLRLVLVTKRELRGRVHPADGTVLREPYVLLRRIEEKNPMWRGSGDAAPTPVALDGTFSMELEESPVALKGVVVRAGDLGAGLSEPVRVEIGAAPRYEVDLFLTPTHAVMGGVVGDDGLPVASACVSLTQPRSRDFQDQFRNPRTNFPVVAVTDARGQFEVRGLAAGRYEMRAWARGAVDAVGEVTVPSPEPLRIMLEKALEIAGRIVTRDGNPVGRIYLWIQLPMPSGISAEEWQRTSSFHGIANLCTNDRSEFRLTGLKKGDYLINVGGGSGGPNIVSKAFEGIPAGSTDLRLVVEPGLAIEGRVVNRSGEGIPGVHMNARIEGKEMVGDSRRSDTTGPDGGFEITGLEAGSYSIWMNVQKGRARRAITREHFAAGSRGVVIEVDDAFASISGTLSDGAGRPLVGVRLRLRGGDSWSNDTATSDAAGRFVFDGISEGEYQMQVEGERYERFLLEGGESVKAGDVTLALRLHEGAAVEGIVRDEAGAPLKNIWVGVESGDRWRSVGTDADGRFRVVGLPADTEARMRVGPKERSEFVTHLRTVRTGASGVAVTLLRGSVTAGRVTDAAGQPLSKVRLRFTPVDGDDTEASARADDDGRFEVRLLDRDYKVTAERVGEEAPPLPCGIVRGGSSDLTVTAK